jgi:hypothetical protein
MARNPNSQVRVGRNDPCPCGSGKKYKKCCLGKEAAASRKESASSEAAGQDSIASESPAAPASPPTGSRRKTHKRRVPSDFPITPYVIAKMAEDTRIASSMPDLAPMLQRHVAEDWTISKVAAKSTAEIEAQLRAYGVRHSRELFLSLAESTHSAWEIADFWCDNNRIKCKGREEDFLGLAACELWKRWLPKRPSVEMLDDWMQEGYGLVEEHKCREACDCWWRVWRTLYNRFSPKMRRMEDTFNLFAGIQSLHNWCQDFEMELHNAALKDPEYDRRRIQYCREWIDQFTEENDLLQMNFRRALAESYLRQGEGARGKEILDQIIEWWPDEIGGYLALADAYSHFFDDTALPKDYDRAIAILGEGLAKTKTKQKDRQILKDRIEEIRVLKLHEGAQ